MSTISGKTRKSLKLKNEKNHVDNGDNDDSN